MKKYNKLRWLLSQLAAFVASRRRFISLSLPTSNHHRLFDLKTKSIVHVHCRGAEDVTSIIQIFFSEFYDLRQIGKRCDDIINNYMDILQSGKCPLIIDCGANIGLTSTYFAMMFPLAKIIAIEPDETNCEFAKINTAEYDVEIVKAAIGSETGSCNIIDKSVNSNSFRIEKNLSASNYNSVDMVTISEIINKYDSERYTPFIVKIDIEGFENELFSKDVNWIPLFQLMIIELHDWMLPGEANSNNFLKEVSRLNRDFLFHNENIFSVRNGT